MPVRELNLRTLLFFWLPLAATWIMMSVEGPFLSAVIARLPFPKVNLAAYGVAFSLALVVESPVIMLMSASTALVNSKKTYLQLRNFTLSLCLFVTLLMLVLITPSVFQFVAVEMIQLPLEVADLTRTACIILLPWPAAIGLRRFYQGLMIRSGQTRRVAYGTMIRLVAMISAALAAYRLFDIDGVAVGAAALSGGVLAECIASRFMVHRTLRTIFSTDDTGQKIISYGDILRFYAPLALTPMIGLGAQPMVTFFMGQARMPLESLAVFPVIHSLSFLFRSLGLSYTEVMVANIGENDQGYTTLRKFAVILALVSGGGLGLIAFTPAADFWFITLSGLPATLSSFAILPTQIFVLLPALSVVKAFQQGYLVHHRQTAPITVGTLIEFTIIGGWLFFSIFYLDLVGAVAGTSAIVVGRIGANLFLQLAMVRTRRKQGITFRRSK